MQKDDLSKVNEFTMNKKHEAEELNQGKFKTATIGSKDFDDLNYEELILDMETRFQNGQIRTYDQYIFLLREHDHHAARFTSMKRKDMFKESIN